ncbi:MAG: hypothetical protein K2X69_00025 [Silvanigrellaceae bacterium]|nr:hypothetical protein [Silvanigrellaceae bacterium]
MKAISVSLLCLSFIQFSNANTNNSSENYVNKKLTCTNIEALNHPQIFKFGLVIQTTSDSSNLNVKSGYLTYTEYFMIEYTSNFSMKLINQDAKYTYFDVDTQPYSVKLDKTNFTAKISHEGKDYYSCQEVK